MSPKALAPPILATLALAFPALSAVVQQAVLDSSQITIHRDAWGVPHIYGPTDASVVFGGAYAQAEDNWPQVEENFVRAIGRGAELDGEDALLDDYLVHGLEIPRRSIEEYERASEELRRLYDGFAAGFNHYPGWLGSVFVFHAEPANDGRRRYGVDGNSFVKVIEFTPDVRARSVFVFGQSGDPASPHYFDQAELYSEKRFKPAWFSVADVRTNAVRTITLEVPAPVGAPGGAGTSGSPTDSCAPDDTTVSFSTEDGGVVYATLRGSGEHTVILAHGGQFTKESWEAQARVLADSGFVTLAIDFRGRGASRGGPGREADLDLADLDVLAAVRFLEACGVRRISIVGASFGGWAAARASTKLPPGSIDRLILLAHSPIEEPERMQGRKLFVTTRDDVRGDGVLRLPSIRDQYERATDPKELLILDGSAHAQHVFGTDQGERLLAEILRFLGGPPALSAPGGTP